MTTGERAAVIALLAGEGRLPRLRIKGRSMGRLLPDGSIVDIVSAQDGARVGEILVFRLPSGRMIAHRIIARRATTYVTAGDALPEQVECVAASDVIGKVGDVYAGAHRESRPARAVRRSLGNVAVRLRPLRLGARRVARLVNALVASPQNHPDCFRALVDIMRAVEGGDVDRVKSRCTHVPPTVLAAVARRHHCSGLLFAGLRHARAHDPGSTEFDALYEMTAKSRAALALQMRRIVHEMDFAIPILREAGIPFVLLKGAARIARRDPDYDKLFSTDIDILLHEADAELAEAAFLRAGYTHRMPARHIARYRRRHHHLAPLFRTPSSPPIELHTALVPPHCASMRLSSVDMQAHIVERDGQFGPVRVLDAVGTALHLAYHAHRVTPLRDVVLLARVLRDFNAAEWSLLHDVLRREKRDAIRLEAVLGFARYLNHGLLECSPRSARYLRWVCRRESLDEGLRDRSQIVDGMFAANLVPLQGPAGVLSRMPLMLARCAASLRILILIVRPPRAGRGGRTQRERVTRPCGQRT